MPRAQIYAHDGQLLARIDATLDERRAELRAQVEARLEAGFATGYTPATGPLAGHTLQTRNEADRINWLTSQATYTAAIAAGFGDVVDASFRTADNATVTVTYAQGLDVLLGMAAWGRALMARSWALKDALTAAQDTAALDEVAAQIEQGWPA